MKDSEILNFLYEKLIHKYNENENVDYMLNFKRIINSLRENNSNKESNNSYVIVDTIGEGKFPLNINGIMRIEEPEHFMDKELKSKIIYLDQNYCYSSESAGSIENKILNLIK